MSALRFLLRVQARTGRSIGVRELFSDATIVGIARRLRTVSKTTTSDVRTLELVRLAEGCGDRVPLVLIHAAGASAMAYVGLARELSAIDPALPIFAVNDRFLEGDDASSRFPYDSIEDVATHAFELVANMLRRRGASRVALGGWSYGGVVSIELARRLADAEVAVETIVALDSPIGQARHQRNRRERGQTAFSHEADASRALKRDTKEVSPISQRSFQHFKACTSLLNLYDESVGSTLSCSLVDVRPSAGSDCDFLGKDGLSDLTDAGIRRIGVEGTHWTLLKGPTRLRALAKIFVDATATSSDR